MILNLFVFAPSLHLKQLRNRGFLNIFSIIEKLYSVAF